MATKNLFQRYADTLAAMEKDAAKNLEEAQSKLQQVQAVEKAAGDELKAIQDTMKENHRGFYGAAKAIIAMAFKRPETPTEIDQALEPIIGYQAAMAAVPAAKKACDEAYDAVLDAEEELDVAEEFCRYVKALEDLETYF